ncbi:hypothetical protein D1818_20965 [Aquimarina sp. BL5]|nr:hypothetical protein D1818_20965 [Aquimarina sp. BL5]RKN02057.1 hypothetical protein D7036_17040 [Aquimarina sp. BL5]
MNIIEKLFPVQSRNNDQLQYDSKILYEFGNIREKKIPNEIYYQLHCLQKAKSFNVYWYD